MTDTTATSCARCEGHPLAPAECQACLAEVATNRAEARRELAEFIEDADWRDHGRVGA